MSSWEGEKGEREEERWIEKRRKREGEICPSWTVREKLLGGNTSEVFGIEPTFSGLLVQVGGEAVPLSIVTSTALFLISAYLEVSCAYFVNTVMRLYWLLKHKNSSTYTNRSK